MALMPSTCSARYSDSRKSQRCPSPLSPATLCKSRRLWLTVFSSSSAAHGEIDVRGIEFHVDLLVDQRLAVLVVVLPDLGHGHLDSCSWSLGGSRKSLELL